EAAQVAVNESHLDVERIAKGDEAPVAQRLLDEPVEGDDTSGDDQRRYCPPKRPPGLLEAEAGDEQEQRLGGEAHALRPGEIVTTRDVDDVEDDDESDRDQEPAIDRS